VIRTVSTTPFDDQKPGTSGLRRKVERFRTPAYVENFVQSFFDALERPAGGAVVVGGDGRYLADHAVQIVLRMAAANGFARAVVGAGGLMSTPAVSLAIRELRAACGVLLTASHNPGGPDGDFGIKFNIATGAPSPDSLNERIFERSRVIEDYRILDAPDVDLGAVGSVRLGDMVVDVVDPVERYADVMERLFDFDLVRSYLTASGARVRFDAMNAVTGPYAREILVRRLGAPEESILRGTPSPDFGGAHPDPMPAHAAELWALMNGAAPPDLGAASDGDGDRNMILGPGLFVSPGDSLAILAAHATLVPGYRDGLRGVARSMPTSTAVDRVAATLGVPCFEVPTGWKFLAELLEAGLVTLCGEESFGTGGSHSREKDGVWAVLFWLSILALRRSSVRDVVHEHWRRFGRTYFVRHDYEGISAKGAESVLEGLQSRGDALRGRVFGARRVEDCGDWSYVNPVTHAESTGHGVRIVLDDGSRITYRTSGTGAEGATLRIYHERHEPAWTEHASDARRELAPLARIGTEIARIEALTGRAEPSAVV
jgi:phosphoglucomutase